MAKAVKLATGFTATEAIIKGNVHCTTCGKAQTFHVLTGYHPDTGQSIYYRECRNPLCAVGCRLLGHVHAPWWQFWLSDKCIRCGCFSAT